MTMEEAYPPLTQALDKSWSAEKLNKPGQRGGMNCIYKVSFPGDSKRAGVYLKRHYVEDGHSLYEFDIGGTTLKYNLGKDACYNMHDGTKNNQINAIKDGKEFTLFLKRTLCYFGLEPFEILNSGWTPPPPVDMTLSAEVIDTIPSFGVF